ncbi:MAG: urease accessory protein UreH [Acidobacteria bacterium]|nr:urease accessory protein UreH [Acidobacteriota bacterium]
MHVPLQWLLGLGFLLGLKHATEADHIVAVTAIVSEERSIWPSSVAGILWGMGHTAALLFAGTLVLCLQETIPNRIAALLESAVALAIILLGTRVLYPLLRKQSRAHVHIHRHGRRLHAHLHFHDAAGAHDPCDTSPGVRGDHRPLRLGWRSFAVGLLHGLAGSAALTLLVLTEVVQHGSRALGLVYLLVFGLGSIGGMFLMSGLISLPFVFSARLPVRVHTSMRLLAGIASIAFGIYYGVETLGRL